MTQRPQLWSIGALAVELNRDPRTVSKALQRVPPDGQLGKNPAWYMKTAAAALAPVERRFRPSNGDDSAAIDAVEATWTDLRRGFERLASEKDVDRRRLLGRDVVGPLIHELEASLNALWRTAEDRLVFGPCRDKLIAVAITELARLCNGKLVDTDDGVALVAT
jgi:hypothetical protein